MKCNTIINNNMVIYSRKGHGRLIHVVHLRLSTQLAGYNYSVFNIQIFTVWKSK